MDYTKIPAPSGKCVVCGIDLVHVEKHPSVLQMEKNGDAQRRDVCIACWEKLSDDKDFFSFWLAQRELPKPDPRQSREEQRAATFRMFERMLEEEDKERFRVHLYVLAHTLMKYRTLKWEGSKRDEEGVEWIIFRNPVTDEKILIREIDPTDERLVAVMREIGGGVATSSEEEPSTGNEENEKKAVP